MSDEYVLEVANKYCIGKDIDLFTKVFVIDPLKDLIQQWAGNCYNDVYLSGSRVKGTAINMSSDLDLFISLKSDTNNTLKEIYQSLNNFLISRGYSTRQQNVSIGVEVQGKQVDLVPAKKRLGNTNYHSLYLSKQDSWTQTNVIEHINKVINSGRITEIVLLGFENHSGRTYHNCKSLRTVIKGFGNNGEDGTEGIYYKNVIGTYLHGPILPKNPSLADHVISTAIERKYGVKELIQLDDTLEYETKYNVEYMCLL
jgi:hypothetical protein